MEVIKYAVHESDEAVFLDVINQVGGRFGEGEVKLSAMLNLFDNDWFW